VFSGDHQSLVVLNTPARIVRNTFEGAEAAAVYAGGAPVVISENRMRSGRNFGIYIERVDHGVVEDNELDHNCSGGVMVRNSRDTQVSFNRVYVNGYGIVLVHGTEVAPNTVTDNLVARHAEDGVYVIGGSPVIRRNRLLENRKSGLHVSSLTSSRGVIVADPLLEANVLSGNAGDAVQRDEFVLPAREISPAEPTDCAWRLGGDTVQVARFEGGR
jgi:hypothetical protein